MEPPNLFQVAAWQAAVVGGILASVQFLLGLWKQRRETRQAQARFGYQLLDAMFEDESVTSFLYALDEVGQQSGQSQTSAALSRAFRTLFVEGTDVSIEARREICGRLDALLYHLDRFEHAINGRLTRFEDVRTPTGYYVGLLARAQSGVAQYASRVGYGRAVTFMARFEEWRQGLAA